MPANCVCLLLLFLRGAGGRQDHVYWVGLLYSPGIPDIFDLRTSRKNNDAHAGMPDSYLRVQFMNAVVFTIRCSTSFLDGL